MKPWLCLFLSSLVFVLRFKTARAGSQGTGWICTWQLHTYHLVRHYYAPCAVQRLKRIVTHHLIITWMNVFTGIYFWDGSALLHTGRLWFKIKHGSRRKTALSLIVCVSLWQIIAKRINGCNSVWCNSSSHTTIYCDYTPARKAGADPR